MGERGRAVENRELAYHGVLPSLAGGELLGSSICTVIDGPYTARTIADRAQICKPFKEHRNRFPQKAGRYDNSI
jgi:hypothetical protein